MESIFPLFKSDLISQKTVFCSTNQMNFLLLKGTCVKGILYSVVVMF